MQPFNTHIHSILTLLDKTYSAGNIEKPVKMKIHRKDKKVLKQIYNIYKIYNYKLTLNDFKNVVIEYTVINDDELINGANHIAKLLEKINK